MKTGGGKKAKKLNIVPLIVILLLAVVIVVALYLISSDDTPQSDSNIDAVQPVDSSTRKILLNESALPDATAPVQLSAEKGDTVITLNNESTTIDGSGASYKDGVLLINRAGVYELSGTLNGNIIVSAAGEDVVLIFNGVNVTSSNSSALYVHNANTVNLIANGETQNVFTDGTTYDFNLDYSSPTEAEPNAAIFSKDDLIIRGTGTFVVNGRYSAGIIGKDNLKIVNTNVVVDAVNNGINGKDSLIIQNSTVNVTAGNDGLRSTQDNNPALGYGLFTDSNITVTANGDGIQVETGLTIDNCAMYILAGGGAQNTAVDSQKGIKCNQGYVNFNSGNIVIDSADDSVNAVGDVSVLAGVLNLSTGDDGIHSDASVAIKGGTVVVSVSHEGLEGVTVDISGGDVYINSKSDGINAAGGSDGEGFDGAASAVGASNRFIRVSDGYVYINSDGDGIDSNGDIYLSGGTVIITGSLTADYSMFDYLGNFNLTGGTLLAMGGAQQIPSTDGFTQNCVDITFSNTLSAETFVSIECDSQEIVFKTTKSADKVIFSSPMLKTGSGCTVSYGGKYSSNENLDGVYTGGRYSGGSQITGSVAGVLSYISATNPE